MADELGADDSRRSIDSGGIIKTGNNISQIIHHLIWEILIILPAESIYRFRTVCKSWRKLIDSPSFIKSQVNKTAAEININSRRLIVFPQKLGIAGVVPKLNSYDIFPSPGDQNLNVASVKELNHPFNDDDKKLMYLVGTSNGLICLEYGFNFEWFFDLWNPSTGIHRIVPDYSDICHLRKAIWVDYCCYLGYDHMKDDYHVIRVTRPSDCIGFIIIAVYSLKNDSWTKIRTKDDWGIELKMNVVYISGTLYMQTFVHRDEKIIAFDVSTQGFRLVELPPPMNNVDRQGYILCELQGRLCIIIQDGVRLKSKHVLWLMMNDDYEDDVKGGEGTNKETLWKRIDFQTWKPVWIDKLLGVLPPAADADAEEEELFLVVMARNPKQQSTVEIGMGWSDHKAKSTTHVSFEGPVCRLMGSDACVCLSTIASPFIL